MFSFTPQPELSIEVAQRGTIYLAPSLDPLTPAPDVYLRGHLILTLPRARAGFTSLRAKLVGTSTYKAGGVYDEGSWGEATEQVLLREVEIKLDARGTLEKGEHRYEFAFMIPASAAPYQRSEYGGTRHFVSATLHSTEGGTFGGKSTNQSPKQEIYLVHNNVMIGDVLEPTNELLSTFSEALGPVKLNISTPYLTVASLILFSFSLPSVLEPLTITAITGFVLQSFHITYPSTSSTPFRTAHPPPKKHIAFHMQQPGLARLQQGAEWEYQKLARIPHDDRVRPSTLEGTATGIRVDHLVGIEVRYRKDGAEGDEILTLAKKMQLGSCCCSRESLTLPSYSATPAKTKLGDKKCSACYCTCSATFEELVAEEDKRAFEVAPATRISIEERGALFSCKSPAASTELRGGGRRVEG